MFKIEKKVVISMTAGHTIHYDTCPPGFLLWGDTILFKNEDCDSFNMDGEPVELSSLDLVQPLDMTGGTAK